METLLRWLIVLFAIAPQCFGISEASAQEGTYQVVIKKQEEKKNARWTLASWLATKETAKQQNMWLAKNSHSSAYEFYLDGGSFNYNHWKAATPDKLFSHDDYFGGLGAYAGIAGLRGRYESTTEGNSLWSGSFNLRILGRALQDTHINIEYGLRGFAVTQAGTTTKEVFQNQFGGVSSNLYLAKHFGLEGSYKKILPGESDQKRALEGEVSEGGVFIDFSFVRVYGLWRKEFLLFDSQGTSSSEFREGYGGGIKLFF